MQPAVATTRSNQLQEGVVPGLPPAGSAPMPPGTARPPSLGLAASPNSWSPASNPPVRPASVLRADARIWVPGRPHSPSLTKQPPAATLQVARAGPQPASQQHSSLCRLPDSEPMQQHALRGSTLEDQQPPQQLSVSTPEHMDPAAIPAGMLLADKPGALAAALQTAIATAAAGQHSEADAAVGYELGSPSSVVRCSAVRDLPVQQLQRLSLSSSSNSSVDNGASMDSSSISLQPAKEAAMSTLLKLPLGKPPDLS